MAAKKPTVRSNKFQRIGDVALDARKRVSLAKALTSLNGALGKKFRAEKNGDLRFEVFRNDAGQILLSPQSVHPREAWLYKNPKAMTILKRGIRQAAQGKLHYLGSFAKYADDEID
jgi:hypothetical protein